MQIFVTGYDILRRVKQVNRPKYPVRSLGITTGTAAASEDIYWLLWKVS